MRLLAEKREANPQVQAGPYPTRACFFVYFDVSHACALQIQMWFVSKAATEMVPFLQLLLSIFTGAVGFQFLTMRSSRHLLPVGLSFRKNKRNPDVNRRTDLRRRDRRRAVHLLGRVLRGRVRDVRRAWVHPGEHLIADGGRLLRHGDRGGQRSLLRLWGRALRPLHR